MRRVPRVPHQPPDTQQLCTVLNQARLPEIDALEAQIKATNEELSDLQYQAQADAAAAAVKEAALTDELASLKAQVRMLRGCQ